MQNLLEFITMFVVFGVINLLLYAALISYAWQKKNLKLFLSGLNFFIAFCLWLSGSSTLESFWARYIPPLLFGLFWLFLIREKPPRGKGKKWEGYFPYLKFLQAAKFAGNS